MTTTETHEHHETPQSAKGDTRTDTAAHPPIEVVDSRMGAALYNPFLWAGEKRGMARLRRELLAGARGTVLEIGAGTGLNLRHYPEGLDELVLAEPGARIGSHIDLDRGPEGVPVRLEQAPAEYLPFEDGSFDTVVATLVLCTVSDPQRAVSEAARVLRPGGRLLFLEHVRADGGWRQAMQRRSVRPWAAFADGCQCDRATVETISDQMRIESLERASWKGMPAIVRPLVWGSAAPQR
jgi:SAM-dependent methyltransferase